MTVTVPCIAHAMLRCNKSHLAVQHERPHTIPVDGAGMGGMMEALQDVRVTAAPIRIATREGIRIADRE
ncbi:hypothetical protein VXM49_23110, partial [Xanthomonas citri pv. citri]